MNTTYQSTADHGDSTAGYAGSHQPDPGRPRSGWRQVGRDLGYLLPGLPIGVASFVSLMVGFWLGVGTIVLAFLGFVVLLATLMIARGFAAAERARVGLMEGRRVGPTYYRTPTGSGFGRIFGYLRDPQLWRDFGHGLLMLPIRVFTWSFTMVWTALSLGATYPLWAWSIPRSDEDTGLLELITGWDSFTADVAFNTAIALVFLVTLPYATRTLATIESSIAWTMLTNENAALRARADELSRSRSAFVQAEADTLRRVERDIHDGPQQRLVRLTMDLQSAQRRLNDDPDAAAPLVEGALKQTEEALAELRALSRGIAPPILTDRGLKAALTAAAARCPIPTTLNIHLDHDQRLPPSVENAAYFVVTESLTNAAKHSDATQCDVTVAVEPSTSWLWGDSDGDPGEHLTHDVLTLWISDDGRGGAHLGKGHGLAGLADRLSGVDGHLTIDSPPGTGTTITATIPLTP
ncbi:sensor histidine kinase [Phytoactinopolyspora halotolerans]|uniref:sensor histidine kinase n=1 Tax=Phytoactinopolyspora halotolerans TaxID=1981512 RepID=UPI001C203076|nr:sensor histidine kinase [Phytoactinopolyspora halotolerans]